MNIRKLNYIFDKRELTKTYKSLLESTYSTPKGGTLRVKYIIGTKYTYNKMVLECSICSADKGLWPIGSIVASKGHLSEGKIPCGCTKVSKLAEYQWIERLKRVLSGSNRELISLPEKEKVFNPRKTFPRVFDKSFNLCFNSVSLYNLVVQCKKDWLKFPAKNTSLRDYSSEIEQAKGKNEYYSTTHFTPLNWFYNNKTNSMTWRWECTSCKEVGYVCGRNARKGVSLCMCDPMKYAETLPHKNKKCIKASTEGREFIHLLGDNHNEMGVKWRCGNNHINISSYNNFVTKNLGCKYCNKSTNRRGFYPTRENETDYLYILRFKDQGFCKVGRSFNPHVRIKGLSKGFKVKTVALYRGTHEEVYSVEQYLINKYAGISIKPPHLKGSPTEYFMSVALVDIIKDISNIDPYLHKVTNYKK
ncbi:conserved hypothetical protein [Vibrio phage 249E41-1]|nr:conserved hypothetical protein [Vibrio phage 249E41-1]